MTTFASGKKIVGSRCYAKFMYTFVYWIEHAISWKINELTSKNVYFYILLTTLHVGGTGYCLKSMG